MLATIREIEAGPGDEVTYRRCDQRLAPFGKTRHAGCDVHGDAPRLLASNAFHLARVQAGPDPDPEWREPVLDAEGASNRARRPIERGEEAVARCVDLLAGESVELPPDDCVMLLDEP